MESPPPSSWVHFLEAYKPHTNIFTVTTEIDQDLFDRVLDDIVAWSGVSKTALCHEDRVCSFLELHLIAGCYTSESSWSEPTKEQLPDALTSLWRIECLANTMKRLRAPIPGLILRKRGGSHAFNAASPFLAYCYLNGHTFHGLVYLEVAADEAWCLSILTADHETQWSIAHTGAKLSRDRTCPALMLPDLRTLRIRTERPAYPLLYRSFLSQHAPVTTTIRENGNVVHDPIHGPWWYNSCTEFSKRLDRLPNLLTAQLVLRRSEYETVAATLRRRLLTRHAWQKTCVVVSAYRTHRPRDMPASGIGPILPMIMAFLVHPVIDQFAWVDERGGAFGHMSKAVADFSLGMMVCDCDQAGPDEDPGVLWTLLQSQLLHTRWFRHVTEAQPEEGDTRGVKRPFTRL